MSHLELVSHVLCPYEQSAVIALTEKGVAYRRIDIDLGARPSWFDAVSPLDKVPLLRVREGQGETILFESAVICEYLEETQPNPLHPADPLERAHHRAWIEFASTTLNDVAGFYNATPDLFEAKGQRLAERFAWLERNLGEGPYFAGERFTLVDAAFAPLLRYFDTFEQIAEFGFFADMPKARAYRSALASRPSVRGAVVADYPERLLRFLEHRSSPVAILITARAA